QVAAAGAGDDRGERQRPGPGQGGVAGGGAVDRQRVDVVPEDADGVGVVQDQVAGLELNPAGERVGGADDQVAGVGQAGGVHDQRRPGERVRRDDAGQVRVEGGDAVAGPVGVERDARRGRPEDEPGAELGPEVAAAGAAAAAVHLDLA